MNYDKNSTTTGWYLNQEREKKVKRTRSNPRSEANLDLHVSLGIHI